MGLQSSRLVQRVRIKHIQLSQTNTKTNSSKRIFLLGPSHHYYLSGCALSTCKSYDTPFGPLRLDQETIASLSATGSFDTMTQSADEAEHSLEMHLPYIYKMLYE